LADYLGLHGFTQRGSMWDEVAGLVGGAWSTPDLPGHGSTPAGDWGRAVALVREWIGDAGPGVTVVGYSMGGRLALAAALEAPEGIGRLVLVSAGAGISDPPARARRLEEDRVLADRIERLGVEVFLTEWMARPMFSGLGRRPAAWGSRDLRMRASNTAAGLAGSLRSLGQGSQPYLGSRLGGLGVPLVAVAGSADATYLSRAGAMAAAVPDGRLAEVPGAGHAVVGEDPAAVARILAG